MNYLFPYTLVPKGSKIVLYGFGEVGKDFYLQIHHLNKMGIQKNNDNEKFYELKAWVDKSFDDYALKPPFDYIRNILNYDFDYIVIAVMRETMANAIRKYLKQIGIPDEKIIWSRSYYGIGHELLPQNKMFTLQNFDFVMNLFDEYWSAEPIFGRSQFYQSFPELGIKGKRNTGERMALYHVKDFLKKNDIVLDIGCNCGFFSMQVAPYVKKIVGYEIEPKFVDIANKVSRFLNINNVDFRCENFLERKDKESTYNIVFSFAVHYWLLELGFTKEEYVDMMYNLLKDDGFLFFDSHFIGSVNYPHLKQYRELYSMFIKKGMRVCLTQNYKCDFEREITVFQKLNNTPSKDGRFYCD